MSAFKTKLALCVTILGFIAVWVAFIAIPIETVRPAQTRLQQYWVTYRLVNIGFTTDQAAEAIRELDIERLGRLAGALGSSVPHSDFISVIGGLLALSTLGSILLL